MVIRILIQQIDRINTLMEGRKQGKGKVMVTWTVGVTFKNTAENGSLRQCSLPYAWKCSRYEIFANFMNDVTLANIYFANISHRCTSLVHTVLSYRHVKIIEHFFKPVGDNDSSSSKAVHAAAVLAAQKETEQAFAKIKTQKFCSVCNS